MTKNKKSQDWATVEPTVFHQTRIGATAKQDIKTLSIIEGRTISQITERAINTYLNSNSKLIQQYHQEQSRGVR